MRSGCRTTTTGRTSRARSDGSPIGCCRGSQGGAIHRALWLRYAGGISAPSAGRCLQSGDPTTEIVPPYDRSHAIGRPADRGLAAGLPSQCGDRGQPLHARRWADRTRSEPTAGAHMSLPASCARGRRRRTWIRPKLMRSTPPRTTPTRPMTDGRTQATRSVPTFSLDSAAVFERNSTWFGKAQPPDPRAALVLRQYAVSRATFAAELRYGADRLQHRLGVHGEPVLRVRPHLRRAPDHRGVTTRWLDASTGAESLRLAIAQRYQFRDQLVTPDDVPQTQRLSDLLLDGSTSLVPNWQFDMSNCSTAPSSVRAVRSIVGVRYLPEPFHALSATCRFTRGLSEQVELGWQ